MNLLEEIKWRREHPHFYERPASMREFVCDEKYLNIAKGVRPGVMKVLIDIFGEEVNPERISGKVREAIVTGGIGIGKTTIASIVIPYMVHWTLCLKNPQEFFSLLPGSRIAFMQMSTSESQAKEVLFGDLKARIENSKWFDDHPFDPNFKNQLRFDKDVWVVPGNSSETRFEGYNILGGILDEIDSHKVTKDKDQADVGYDTITNRITSRFGERGFLLLIGQTKRLEGFADRKYNEFLESDRCVAIKMAIWESFGWDKYLKPNGARDTFYYDVKRKRIITDSIAQFIQSHEGMIEVPNYYHPQFKNQPEKALRDLAGIPPNAGDPFISMDYKIEEARDRWINKYGEQSPVDTNCITPKFADWFRASDSIKRVAHVDIATSADGDALGLAMGHVRELVSWEDELKPYIVFDFLMRFKAPPGGEIILSDIRKVLYHVRDDLKFKLKKVTLDGYQSTDFMQQMRKKRFEADYLSMDRQLLPYHDLRDALYEDRVEFPKYVTYLQVGDDNTVEIAYKELSQLEDLGNKIDHPDKGSKDVADAMAGVAFTLMDDRRFRKGGIRSAAGSFAQSTENYFANSPSPVSQSPLATMPSARAPLPPSITVPKLLPPGMRR